MQWPYGIVERLEVVPFVDGHRGESRQHVVRERRFAAIPLDHQLDVARRTAGRLMGDRRVQRVELILEEDLPVRALDDSEAVRHQLDFAFRGAIAHVVEGNLGRPEKLEQRRTLGREAREHEPPVGLHAGGSLHVAVRVVAREPRAFVTGLHHRDVAQLAVVVKGPGVVGTAEEVAGAAVAVAAHHRPAVRAAVVQHVHLPVCPAHHQHRLAPDLHRVVVAGLLDLAFVPAVDPHPLVYALHLQRENGGIGIDLPADPVRLDESGQVGNLLLKHGNLLQSLMDTHRLAGSARCGARSGGI